MAYTGRCACGAVTARIEREPLRAGQCWCRQCQKSAGGGPTANAIFPASAVTLEGELSRHSYRAASGNTIHHHFCPKCGATVMGTVEERPGFFGFRFGFLDEGHGLRPQNLLWLDEAPSWAAIDPALNPFPRQPPPPKPSS